MYTFDITSLIDLWLLSLSSILSAVASTSASLTLSLYNKSKKQVKAEIFDDKDKEGGAVLTCKKVDLRYAITSLFIKITKLKKY
jgi:hypothetical protein